jgi:hypothetical protein
MPTYGFRPKAWWWYCTSSCHNLQNYRETAQHMFLLQYNKVQYPPAMKYGWRYCKIVQCSFVIVCRISKAAQKLIPINSSETRKKIPARTQNIPHIVLPLLIQIPHLLLCTSIYKTWWAGSRGCIDKKNFISRNIQWGVKNKHLSEIISITEI